MSTLQVTTRSCIKKNVIARDLKITKHSIIDVRPLYKIKYLWKPKGLIPQFDNIGKHVYKSLINSKILLCILEKKLKKKIHNKQININNKQIKKHELRFWRKKQQR